MPWINPDDLDKVFEWYLTVDFAVYLCSQEPTTLAQATTTYALANKAPVQTSGVGPRSPSGRQFNIGPIQASDPGDVTAGGTATHWAVVDTDNNVLRATGELAAPIVLVADSTFTLPAFSYGIAQAITG